MPEEGCAQETSKPVSRLLLDTSTLVVAVGRTALSSRICHRIPKPPSLQSSGGAVAVLHSLVSLRVGVTPRVGSMR